MTNPIFRASYSILSSWEAGYAQQAIEMYFKLPRETNKYMEDGIRFHNSWEDYINKNKQMHPQLSSICEPLKDPVCELKLEMPINDHINLVGVIDCLDVPKICEFKSGVKSACAYAETKQIPVYALLAEYHVHTIDRGTYYHWDQYFKETDCSNIWITEKVKKEALEWVIKVSEEMYDYLIKNKLFEKYGDPNAVVVDVPIEETVL